MKASHVMCCELLRPFPGLGFTAILHVHSNGSFVAQVGHAGGGKFQPVRNHGQLRANPGKVFVAIPMIHRQTISRLVQFLQPDHPLVQTRCGSRWLDISSPSTTTIPRRPPRCSRPQREPSAHGRAWCGRYAVRLCCCELCRRPVGKMRSPPPHQRHNRISQ